MDPNDINSYLESIAKRIASLEVQSEELDDGLDDQMRNIRKMGSDVREGIGDIHRDSAVIKRKINELSMSINTVIAEFKNVARKNSMERLDRKIDEWNPEGLATFKKFKKELGKLK